MSAMLPGRPRPGNHRAGSHRANTRRANPQRQRPQAYRGARRLARPRWQAALSRALRRWPLLVAVLALVPLAGSVGAAARLPAVQAAQVTPSSQPPSTVAVTPPTDPSDAVPSNPTLSAPTPAASATVLLPQPPNARRGEQAPVPDQAVTTETVAGALAEATYFIRAVDWSIATNDPSLIEGTALPTCRACRGYIAQLTALRQGGATLHGGRWRLRSISIVHGRSSVAADFVFRAVVDQAAARVTAPGSAPSTVPARRGVTTYVFVSWVDGRWQIAEQTS